MSFAIGAREIGFGHRPLIVAEMSGNHNGSLERAQEIVRTAAACGAGAIKLQTFTAGTLTLDSRRAEFFIDEPDGPWHGRRLWELYDEAHTPWEWHKPLFDAARGLGLACISTAYDFTSLEFLASIGVDAIKIASFELVHLPLIQACARFGKPVLLSTGMATLDELNEATAALRSQSCERFVLLKCTSAYPSQESDANIHTMTDMRKRYACEVGLSDHNLGPHTALAAVALGAAVIEKHFTLARADGGVDAAFSIEPNELRDLVHGANFVWQSLGEVRYGPVAAEAASLRERPSIFVARPMSKGQTFNEANIRIVRPAGGLAPKHYAGVIGRRCARDIDAATPLSWDHVEGEEARSG
jgi:N-acetylneuraminate synthase